MFRFFRKMFFMGLTILSNFANAIPLNAATLSCISMSNQACKVRPEIVNVNSKNPYFILLMLKQLNVVVIVIILMIHMQMFVFLILQKF